MNLDTRNALVPKYSLVKLLIRISVIAADKVFCIFSVAWNRTANLRLRSWKQYCVEQNIVDFRSQSIKGPDFGNAKYSDGGYEHG
jgi:hypothetical protein